MSAMVSIVRATTAAECASVRALAVAHARYERSDTVVPADWATRILDLIRTERLELFLAEVSATPVGFATLTHDVGTWAAAPYAHLDSLYVAEGHRDAGVGKLLTDAVIELARERGSGELQWQTPTWNSGAIRFYNRLGARQQRKERFTLALM